MLGFRSIGNTMIAAHALHSTSHSPRTTSGTAFAEHMVPRRFSYPRSVEFVALREKDDGDENNDS